MPPRRRRIPVPINPVPIEERASHVTPQNQPIPTPSNQPVATPPQQPVAAPPPQPERRIAELFLRQNPPTFTGAGSPSEAEEWVRSVERIFKLLECSDQERMLCISFLLKGLADYWWEARQKTLTPEQLAGFTWEQFKEELYAKFIPRSYRKQKEIEFLNLKQGNKSVAEYDREFCSLSRYAPYRVESDERMAELFRSGLRQEIRVILAAQPPMSYAETLNRALDMEMEMQKDKLATEEIPTIPQGQPVSESSQGGQKSKGKRKWEGQSTPAQRPFQRQRSFQPPFQPRPFQPSLNQSNPPLCPRCNRTHFGRCSREDIFCFSCGQRGHYSFDCPQRPKPSGGSGRGNFARPPQPLKAIMGFSSDLQPQPSSPLLLQNSDVSPSQLSTQSSQPGTRHQRAYALRSRSKESEESSGNLAGIGQLNDIPVVILLKSKFRILLYLLFA